VRWWQFMEQLCFNHRLKNIDITECELELELDC